MTKEERVKRKEEREAKRQAEALLFPEVRWNSRELQLLLEEGDKWSLRIRVNGLSHFQKEHWDHPHEWHQTYFDLRDIEPLASLIAGLTCRLNNLIEKANNSIRAIPERKELEVPK